MTVTIDAPASQQTHVPRDDGIELSVVIPCLNESETVGTCVAKAVKAMAEAGINGEVVLTDNGSTDGSQQIAEGEGARVVNVERKGYGAALMGGIAEARGRYILMGDADDSYDFSQLARFVEKIREGHDLVQGCRLPAGGGTVLPGAMPFLHRWVGNPVLTWIVRSWFRAPVHDVYCGMRAFTRGFYDDSDMRCTGMEFATEMIIKAGLFKRNVAEVPITLHPDGRKTGKPHLRTFRDGWRTLRFFLLYSPKWLFWQPGRVGMLLGVILMLLGVFGPMLGALPVLGGITFGVHTMLIGALLLVVGHQALMFAVLAKTFAIGAGLIRGDRRLPKWYRRLSLERGMLLGFLSAVAGLGLLVVPTAGWIGSGFDDLHYPLTLPWVVGGATLILLGAQSFLASWFVSLLLLPRR